jgi:septal ring factor EnvC (AmiA/AmiB activator)
MIEGMSCEVCVSEDAYRQMAEDLRDLRAEVREERREQAELEGRLERANAEVNRLLADEVIRIELERKNATLDQEIERRARREKVAWGLAAASTAAAGVMLFFVLQ